MAKFLDRVKVSTATTGTGTVTLSGAVSSSFATFAEAGAVNGGTYRYIIEDAGQFEIGEGVYSTSGPTLTRAVVLMSKVGGSMGTTKINLSGNAIIFSAPSMVDVPPAIPDATEDTAPDGTADFLLSWDTSASAHKKVKPANLTRSGGMQLFAQGTVSAAAALDIVLPSGFRAYKFILNDFLPATDVRVLCMRTSSDGGVSFDSATNNYGYGYVAIDGGAMTSASDPQTAIMLMPDVGGGANTDEGCSIEVTLFNPFGTTQLKRIIWHGMAHSAANDFNVPYLGGGDRASTADIDAVRFLFLTLANPPLAGGNIASGTYAAYGLV
jgi:hypothetical protein